MFSTEYLNSLPNDAILGMSKFKASSDDKFGVAEIMGFVFERLANIVGKGENAGNQHFLFFLQWYQDFLPWVVESRDCVVKS